MTPRRFDPALAALLAFVMILPALVISPGAAAAGRAIHDLEDIRRTASDFLLARAETLTPGAEVAVGRLDPRLRLPRCEQALEAFPAPGSRTSGNLTVGVRCPGTRPWSLYVPATVREFQEVLVLAHPVPRGRPIGQADVRSERREVSRLRMGYFVEPAQVIGKALRQPLSGGAVLHPGLVVEPLVVRRGQSVTLLAAVGALRVRSAGRALADAAAGERVRVENVRSDRIVEGVAIGDGVVRVPM